MIANKYRTIIRDLVETSAPGVLKKNMKKGIQNVLTPTTNEAREYALKSLREGKKKAKNEYFVEEVASYLKAARTHSVLLSRYNPAASLDELERVRLTARRVGLDLPKDITKRFEEEK